MTEEQLELLAEDLGVPVESLPPQARVRYNIAPTNEHFIVVEQNEVREAVPARWGLVNSWAKDAKRAAMQINARAETIERTPAFRQAFQKRRCLVPATGFFEWAGPKESRQPTWFHRPDDRLILFAGLYELWMPAPGTWQRTFTIVTTGANGVVAPIHDRMPAVLAGEAAGLWIDPNHPDPQALLGLLGPAPERLLVARRVSPLVNSVRNDFAAVLEEAGPPEPAGEANLRLL